MITNCKRYGIIIEYREKSLRQGGFFTAVSITAFPTEFGIISCIVPPAEVTAIGGKTRTIFLVFSRNTVEYTTNLHKAGGRNKGAVVVEGICHPEQRKCDMQGAITCVSADSDMACP